MALETDEEFQDDFYQKHLEEPESFCYKTNKISFVTKTQAKKNRPRFERKYRTYFGVYQCEFCKDWHLTTVDKDERKNLKNGRKPRS
jgi:hypothetical protein